MEDDVGVDLVCGRRDRRGRRTLSLGSHDKGGGATHTRRLEGQRVRTRQPLDEDAVESVHYARRPARDLPSGDGVRRRITEIERSHSDGSVEVDRLGRKLGAGGLCRGLSRNEGGDIDDRPRRIRDRAVWSGLIRPIGAGTGGAVGPLVCHRRARRCPRRGFVPCVNLSRSGNDPHCRQ